MKCKNPNYIRIGKPDENGKYHPLFVNGSRLANYSAERMLQEDFIEVPCGNCIPCRLEYSRNWANRCYLESLCHEHTWFITLTYRDEELVYGSIGLPTLEKDALGRFMKNLRDKLGHDKNIRYFGCGEYGDAKGERAGFNPHYHIIVFGAPVVDLVLDHPDMSKSKMKNGNYPIFRRNNKRGEPVMWSQTIYNCWQKGKIEIEEATWNTAAYVSRYVLKKVKGTQKIIYDRLGIVPEYIRMSNRPGIGAEYLMTHKDKLLDLDYMSVKNAKGVQTCHPPRYFEKLMNKDEESIESAQMAAVKVKRVRNALKRCQDSTSRKSLKQKHFDDAEIIETKTKVFTRDLN